MSEGTISINALKARTEFPDENSAWQWVADMMEFVYDDHCVDNHRLCYLDDEASVLAYNEKQNDGCCGFFDREVTIAGRRATIGCNYGH